MSTIDRAYLMIDKKQNVWFGDSGASCHITNNDTGMFNWKTIDDDIGTGDGRSVTAIKEGSIRLKVCQRNGDTCMSE
jgi:hypothetical protein